MSAIRERFTHGLHSWYCSCPLLAGSERQISEAFMKGMEDRICYLEMVYHMPPAVFPQAPHCGEREKGNHEEHSGSEQKNGVCGKDSGSRAGVSVL